jgi:Transposase DDE domain
VDADLDTLATALYVRVDDLLKCHPERAPWRPRVGVTPKLSDAELLGFSSERRWLRFARAQLGGLFPYLPKQPGYNKRLRKLADTICWLITALARDTTLWTDDVWLADSTPVECGRSRETAQRSDLAGFAEYGYCASHSRYLWGLRLHLLCTVGGLPVGFALTGAKADERHALLAILAGDLDLAERTNQILIADKNYYGRQFEATLAQGGIEHDAAGMVVEPEVLAALEGAAAREKGPRKPGKLPRWPSARQLGSVRAPTAASAPPGSARGGSAGSLARWADQQGPPCGRPALSPAGVRAHARTGRR